MIAADTRVTIARGSWRVRGVVKSCMLSPRLCLSFSNSPESAQKAVKKFHSAFPRIPKREAVEDFFAEDSQQSGNEYILAFHGYPIMTKISETGVSRGEVLWIGDVEARNAFLRFERGERRSAYSPVARGGVFNDDFSATSSAAKLIQPFYDVVRDPAVESVGDFFTVVNSHPSDFKFLLLAGLQFDPLGGLPLELRDADPPPDENQKYRFSLGAPVRTGESGALFYYPVGQFGHLHYGDRGEIADKFAVVKGSNVREILDECQRIAGIEFVLITSEPIDPSAPEEDGVTGNSKWRRTYTVRSREK